MNPFAKLRVECHKLIEKAKSKAYPNIELPQVRYSEPPNLEMGALSSPVCFQLARGLNESPKKIAETLIKNSYTSKYELISKVEAVNGYINFHTDTNSYSKLVLETVINENEEYGFIKTATPKKVMVEHTSANPISPIHIGNARNSILGSSLAKILEKRGNEVVVHFLVNDVGRQVAMTAYGWKLLGDMKPKGRAEVWIGGIYACFNVISEIVKYKESLKEAEENGWVYQAQEAQEELDRYEKASKDLQDRFPLIYKKLAETIPQIPNLEEEIASFNTSYENNDPETVKDIRQMVNYCLKGFEESLGEMNITFDSFDYESDLVWKNAAENVLEKLVDSSYVIKDQGALILDCDLIANDYDLKERWGLHPEHEIPKLVLVRGDGTTLYTLRDMAYSIWKFSIVDRVINVIGQEQNLAQLQLRIALAAIDYIEMADNQIHYGYEHVKLPGFRMSGRLGQYVTLLDVNEKAEELAYEEVNKRSPELNEREKKEIAKIVAFGAVKYTLLSVDPNKQVIFDWDRALNFETNSAPYIQYSHARTCNIIKKATSLPLPDYNLLTNFKEKDLVVMLGKFPEVFIDTADELKPGDITSYANNLADKFNSFYATQNVLQAETPELSAARLKIVDASRITLRNSLNLLGITAPERM